MIQKKYNSPIPENYESEIVVLSSMITNYDSLLMVMEFSESPEDLFFNNINKYVFKIIQDLFKSKIKIDITLLKAQVNKDNGEITDNYLLELLQAHSTYNLEWHLKLLHDLAVRRKLLPEIEKLFEAVKTHKIDYNEFIGKVYDIKNKYELNENIYTDLQVMAHQNFNDFVDNEIFYQTGINILDEYLIGFFNQQVITIAGAPGSGKCQRYDAKILMFDGSIKRLDELRIGDNVMGVDSLPRKILGMSSGKDYLFAIKQKKGNSYFVTGNHILSLKTSGYKGETGSIINISVNDYLKSADYFKMRHKGYKAEIIEFKKREVLIDPYFLGVWLGDGNNANHYIHNPEPEIENFMKIYAESIDHNFVKRNLNYACPLLSIKRKSNFHRNYIQDIMRKLNMFNNKHIPDIYKINNSAIRLRILAGLIDSDGHKTKRNYEIITKYKKLNEDILFLCRSLGFYAVSKKCIKKIKSIGFEGEYFRIYISGDLYKIPCLVKRKKYQENEIDKRVNKLVSQIDISKQKKKEKWIGIKLSGDGLYILDDFTVTHNTTLGMQFVVDIGHGLIISQEMSKGELYKKLISRYAEVDSRKLIKGLNKCSDDEMRRIINAIAKVKENIKLKVVDKRLSFNQILNTIRKICRSHEIKIIMIDYLQLLTIDNYKHNRTGEYEVMTREIKGLAKELNKPIILISQLVKDGYDKQPTLADLRGSGSIAQDADIILFTWQNSIIIGKSRGAKTGQVDNIKLIGEHSYFLDITGNKCLYV